MFLIALAASGAAVAPPVPPRLTPDQYNIAAPPAPPVVEAARPLAHTATPAPVSVDCFVMRDDGYPAWCLPTTRASKMPAGVRAQLHDAMLANVYRMRAAALTRSGLMAAGHSVVLRQTFRLPQ